ncbi:MAG TPA: hypothetical protein PL143_08695 [Rhodocyclaceae bacterium]|nr:hypothetical protein [Rhodocyclaceae bacterium]
MPQILRRDRRIRPDDGLNALFGSTAIAGDPDTPAPSRRAQLLRSVLQPTLVAATTSDADGTYAFDRIRHRTASDGYTVIAYDHTGVHKPAAAANLVPSPMPPNPAEHP